jgi:hypothetical protein
MEARGTKRARSDEEENGKGGSDAEGDQSGEDMGETLWQE